MKDAAIICAKKEQNIKFDKPPGPGKSNLDQYHPEINNLNFSRFFSTIEPNYS